MGRRARLAGAFSLVLICVGCSAGSALADEPAPEYSPPSSIASEPKLPELAGCPAGELEPYEGEDDAAGETRRLRGELAETCSAITDRIEVLRERLWWVVAEQLDAKAQRVVTNEKLSALVDALDGSPALPVVDATAAESTDGVVSAVDASGTVTKEALWFLAGLGVALLAGYAIYRQVFPRA